MLRLSTRRSALVAPAARAGQLRVLPTAPALLSASRGLALTAPRPRQKLGPAPQARRQWEDPEAAAQQAILQFIDPYERDPELDQSGRRWRASEIRLKSNEELQKLWVLLLRERNMLHSTRELHKKRRTKMPHRQRIAATRKSMAMIKLVLHERQTEKAARAARLAAAERERRALSVIDLAASEVWPAWVPGRERSLTVAAREKFTVVLRTLGGSAWGKAITPPAEALELAFAHGGVPIGPEHLSSRVHVRPPATSRPHELTYECNLVLAGGAVPGSAFRRASAAAEPPPALEVSATLYGEPLGGGPVPVRLVASSNHRRREYMAFVNRQMRAAAADAGSEGGGEAVGEGPSSN